MSDEMKELLKAHQTRMEGLIAGDARKVERLAKAHAKAIYLHSVSCLPGDARHKEVDDAILDGLNGEEEPE